MANFLSPKMIVATVFASLTAIAGTAQVSPPPPPPPVVAPKPPAKTETFEAAHQALQRAQAELARSMDDLKLAIPPLPNEAELETVMRQIKKATEAQLAAAAIAEKNTAAMQKEMAIALNNAQDAVKNLKESKALQVQQKELQLKVEAEMKKAQASMAVAAEEMRAFEAFVNSLSADGLITNENYRIEEKNGKLFIDGKEQPAAIYEKHREFLQKHKGLKITKDRNGLQMGKE